MAVVSWVTHLMYAVPLSLRPLKELQTDNTITLHSSYSQRLDKLVSQCTQHNVFNSIQPFAGVKHAWVGHL
jgi:hypothetical protein